MKWLLKVLAVLVVSLPMAVVGTFALGDLWAWVEDRYGIESVGHAMYAGWCFSATYAVIAVVLLAVFARPKRSAAPSEPRRSSLNGD